MPTTRYTLTDLWQQISVTDTVLYAQASDSASIHIGATAPAGTAAGHTIARNKVLRVPELATLGGNAWAKGSGILTVTSG